MFGIYHRMRFFLCSLSRVNPGVTLPKPRVCTGLGAYCVLSPPNHRQASLKSLFRYFITKSMVPP